MYKIFSYSTLFLGASASIYGLTQYPRLIPVSSDEIIHAWLVAECNDPNHQFAYNYSKAIKNHGPIILEQADFTNSQQNNARRAVFNQVRGQYSLWDPIYEHTKWYKTRIIINNPLRTIYGPFPPNTNISNKPLDLNNIILWGHNTNNLIVLEGNHRWYARNPYIPYHVSVYIGLSSLKYPLHAKSGCSYCKSSNDDIPLPRGLLGI